MAVGTHSFVSTPTGSAAGTGLTLSVTVRWNTTQFSKWNAHWSVTTRGTGYKAGESLTIARPSSGLPSSSVFPNGATFVIAGVELPSGEKLEGDAVLEIMSISFLLIFSSTMRILYFQLHGFEGLW